MDPPTTIATTQRAAIKAGMRRLKEEAIAAGRKEPATSTLYHKARCEVDPEYRARTLEAGRKYMAERILDPEFRAAHNKRTLAINNARWANDPEYRARLNAWQRAKTLEKKQGLGVLEKTQSA